MSSTDRKPYIRLIAQLCGIENVSLDLKGIFTALRACVSLGERGWIPALALMNIIMSGGETAVPDLASPIPPGYTVYLKRIALVDNVVISRYLSDVIVRKEVVFHDDEDEEGRKVRIIVDRFPSMFGVLIEYDHPIYGINRDLWVFTIHPTGENPAQVFHAPNEVADLIAGELSATKRISLEDPSATVKLIEETKHLLKRYGSYDKLMDAVARGEAELPEGVSIMRRGKSRKEDMDFID